MKRYNCWVLLLLLLFLLLLLLLLLLRPSPSLFFILLLIILLLLNFFFFIYTVQQKGFEKPFESFLCDMLSHPLFCSLRLYVSGCSGVILGFAYIPVLFTSVVSLWCSCDTITVLGNTMFSFDLCLACNLGTKWIIVLLFFLWFAFLPLIPCDCFSLVSICWDYAFIVDTEL